MTQYRVYLIGPDARIRHAHVLECEDDAEVIARVREMDRSGMAAEIWDGARKLAVNIPPN